MSFAACQLFSLQELQELQELHFHEFSQASGGMTPPAKEVNQRKENILTTSLTNAFHQSSDQPNSLF